MKNKILNKRNGIILAVLIVVAVAAAVVFSTTVVNGISSSKAKSIALEAAGGGQVKSVDLERENGTAYYEVEIVKDNQEYDYYVDGKTGVVRAEKNGTTTVDGQTSATPNTDDTDNNDDGEAAITKEEAAKLISMEKAKGIVTAKLSGGEVQSIYLEKENGKYVYDGEAILGNYEYDFEIDAATGSIVQWEKSTIDHDDKYDTDDNYDDDTDDNDDDN